MHPHKNRKLFLFILTVLAISGAGFAVYQVYDYIYGSLRFKGEIKSISQLREESQLRSVAYFMSLQKQDTDKDGLSDYDEMYNYQTSPFLEDSDSDGLSDKVELEAGGDPLCHKDKDCSGETASPFSPLTELEAQIPILNQPLPENTLSQEDQETLKQASADLSAEELRSLLEQNGFTEEQMEAFSDEELLETWQRVLGGQ